MLDALKTVKLRLVNKRTIFLLMTIVSLFGCSRSPEDQYAIHDVKYRARSAAGQPVEPGTGDCVEDTQTGLTWEMKSDQPGLHDWRNRYTWFNPNESNNELDYRGVADGGECKDSACDTWGFVLAVNDEALCGFDDWRMPTRNELYSISDQRRVANPPTANVDYFPFMQADEYWTGYDYGMQYQSAWAWNFIYGHDRVDWKRAPKYVRLVRGQATELQEVKE